MVLLLLILVLICCFGVECVRDYLHGDGSIPNGVDFVVSMIMVMVGLIAVLLRPPVWW